MPLTVKQIEAATFGRSKERLGDGSGLFLRLYPSGSKIFQVLLPAEAGSARRVWVSVGDFPARTLKEAREIAYWARTQSARGWSAERIRSAVRSDVDKLDLLSPGASEPMSSNVPASRQGRGKPKAVAVTAATTTFADVAQLWFQQKSQGLSNGKHIAQNWTTIQTYVLPVLGNRPVAETAFATVAQANGQQVLKTVKVKEMGFTSKTALEAHLRELLEMQDHQCALTGLPFSYDDPMRAPR